MPCTGYDKDSEHVGGVFATRRQRWIATMLVFSFVVTVGIVSLLKS